MRANNELRKNPRVIVTIPISISIGTQLTVTGQIKDLSVNGIFVLMKNNIFLDVNDELGFSFEHLVEGAKENISGKATVVRIVKGEGFVVAFKRLDGACAEILKKIVHVKEA